MNKLIIFFAAFAFFSCGSGKNTPEENKKNDTTSAQVNPPVDKSYLKKRPEEFKEFFMLNSVTAFKGKVATKKDVASGDAVFNMDSKGDTSHKALNIRIPFFAFLIQKNNQPPKFVAIMQAEVLRGDTIMGYKEANGLFGICNPKELEYFESQKSLIFNPGK